MRTHPTLPLYAEILVHDLARRKSINPRYSLRAYARRLEMDPSELSRVLAGKRSLSLPVCRKILPKLGLPKSKRTLFIESLAQEKMLCATKLFSSGDLPLSAEQVDSCRQAFEAALNAVLILDPRSGVVLTANDAVCQLYGI